MNSNKTCVGVMGDPLAGVNSHATPHDLGEGVQYADGMIAKLKAGDAVASKKTFAGAGVLAMTAGISDGGTR